MENQILESLVSKQMSGTQQYKILEKRIIAGIRSVLLTTVLAGCVGEPTTGAVAPSAKPLPRATPWQFSTPSYSSPTPTPHASVTPSPTPIPTPVPTPSATAVPTPEPTLEPTPEPTEEPTPEPTLEPTPYPTAYPTIYEFAEGLTDEEWEKIGAKHVGERHQIMRAVETPGSMQKTGDGNRIHLNAIVFEQDIPIYVEIIDSYVFPDQKLQEEWVKEAIDWMKAQTGLSFRLATEKEGRGLRMRIAPEGIKKYERENILGIASSKTYPKNYDFLYVPRTGHDEEDGFHAALFMNNMLNFHECSQHPDVKDSLLRKRFISVFIHEVLHLLHMGGHYYDDIQFARDPKHPDELMKSLMLPYLWTTATFTPKKECASVSIPNVWEPHHREIAMFVLLFKMEYVKKYVPVDRLLKQPAPINEEVEVHEHTHKQMQALVDDHWDRTCAYTADTGQ